MCVQKDRPCTFILLPFTAKYRLSIVILCSKAKEMERGLIFNIGTNSFCAVGVGL